MFFQFGPSVGVPERLAAVAPLLYRAPFYQCCGIRRLRPVHFGWPSADLELFEAHLACYPGAHVFLPAGSSDFAYPPASKRPKKANQVMVRKFDHFLIQEA